MALYTVLGTCTAVVKGLVFLELDTWSTVEVAMLFQETFVKKNTLPEGYSAHKSWFYAKKLL